MVSDSTIARQQYTLTTGSDVLPFDFYTQKDADLICWLTPASGDNPRLMVIDVDYSVDGTGDEEGNVSVTVGGLAVGDVVTVLRSPSLDQLLNLVFRGRAFSKNVEDSLDKLTMIAIALQEQVNRSLKYPTVEQSAWISDLPAQDDRADKYLAFDGNGDLTVIAGEFGDIDWSDVTGTPTTLGGYGINDAYSSSQSDSRYQPIFNGLTGCPVPNGSGWITNLTVGGLQNSNIILYLPDEPGETLATRGWAATSAQGTLADTAVQPNTAPVLSAVNMTDLPSGGSSDIQPLPNPADDARSMIQAAIDAAPSGGTVSLAAGTFAVTEDGTSNRALYIGKPLEFRMSVGTILLLDDAVAADVAVVQIGDGATVIDGVEISGGEIDGNAVANGGAYSTTGGGINIYGPVANINIESTKITNMLGGGLICDGGLGARAKYISVTNTHVTECGEGVKFQRTDEFHMSGGSITDMHSQDCFEPHGGLKNWSLRDCYVARPDPTNSAIEVFPQYGDIIGGVIDNCVIEGDELRVSLSSGTDPEDYTVFDLTVTNCHFDGSIIYASTGGKYRNFQVIGNTFEGPSLVPRNVPTTIGGHGAIYVGGAGNTATISDNSISRYEGRGIASSLDNGIFQSNRVFNNGTNTGLSISLLLQMTSDGDNNLIDGNFFYDDQDTPTAWANLAYDGDRNRITNNTFDLVNTPINNSGKSPTNTKLSGNAGFPDELVFELTIPSTGVGSNSVDYQTLGFSANIGVQLRIDDVCSIVPQSDGSPITRVWPVYSGGDLKIQADVAPTVDTVFRITTRER